MLPYKIVDNQKEMDLIIKILINRFMKAILILIFQCMFLINLMSQNDTSSVRMIFRICDNHRSVEFPIFSQDDLNYSYIIQKDTLFCKISPIIKVNPYNTATSIEEGVRIKLSKKKKEYVQILSIPLFNLNDVSFIIVTYKNYKYFFRKHSIEINTFEMMSFTNNSNNINDDSDETDRHISKQTGQP